MPSRRFVRCSQLCSAILLSGVLTCAEAVELGEVAARSHIGQQLVADIELTVLADPAAVVRVALANPDVYRGANISMHPVLASLTMSVMRRDDRQYLHITSLKPVVTEYVHVFLELTEGSRRTVRGATIWLTPDPHPPSAPIPVKAPVAVQAPVPVKAPALAPAFAPAPAPAARQLPAPVVVAAPLRLPLPQVSAAACPQPYSTEQIKACAALDYKNATLSAQIVELEEKVKLLQVAIEARVTDAAPAAAALVKAAVAPKPTQPAAITRARTAGATPWLFIGIAAAIIAAALGALAFVLWRRRRARNAEPAGQVATSFIQAVKKRLLPAKKEA